MSARGVPAWELKVELWIKLARLSYAIQHAVLEGRLGLGSRASQCFVGGSILKDYLKTSTDSMIEASVAAQCIRPLL